MNKIYHGGALEVMRQWPDGCVDMCVTSPPYWGLRDYGIDGQLGLEKTPEEYVGKLVEIFREVRRVLGPWGGAWLNLGDSYAGSMRGYGKDGKNYVTSAKQKSNAGSFVPPPAWESLGLKPKDLCMIPARVALALQADGWWLRSDIIWAKPNPMPESVTDRPTSSYEHVFLLTKSAKYFYDAIAVQEPHQPDGRKQTKTTLNDGSHENYAGSAGHERWPNSGRNLRNVWTIATQPYPGAHFATFPEELPRRCILAGTSAKGNCAECGKPWVRVVEKEKRKTSNSKRYSGCSLRNDSEDGRYDAITQTLGWQPSCKCKADTVPAVVLDPFFGSGTVGKVATDLGRNWLGIEISGEYIEQAKRRTAMRGLHEALTPTESGCDDCGKPYWLHEPSKGDP
jgi:DNA modification methylase